MDKKNGNKSKNKMQRIVVKVLVFCLVMLSFSDFSGIVTYADAKNEVYFSNGGNKYASGTKSNPFETLEQALNSIKNTGGTVIALGAKGSSTNAVQGILVTPKTDKLITITSENGVEIPFRHNIVLQGDVKFENVKIKMGGTSSTGNNNRIVANGHHLHMGQGLEIVPYTNEEFDLLPRLYAGGYGKTVENGKITVESGEYSGIYAGGINTKNIVYGGGSPPIGYPLEGNDAPALVKGNVKIEIKNNNGTGQMVRLRGKNTSPIISVSGEGTGSVINGNVEVTLDGVGLSPYDNVTTRIIKTNEVKGISKLKLVGVDGKVGEIKDVGNVIITGGSEINGGRSIQKLIEVDNLTLDSSSRINLKHNMKNAIEVKNNYIGNGIVSIDNLTSKGGFDFKVGGKVSGTTRFSIPKDRIKLGHTYFTANSKYNDNSGFVLADTYGNAYQLNESGQNPIKWKIIDTRKTQVYVDKNAKSDGDGTENTPVKTLEEGIDILYDRAEINGLIMGMNSVYLKSDISIDKPLHIAKRVKIQGHNGNKKIDLNSPIVMEDTTTAPNRIVLSGLTIDVSKSPTKDLIDLNTTHIRDLTFENIDVINGNINIVNKAISSIVDNQRKTDLYLKSGNFGNIFMGDIDGKAPYYAINISGNATVKNIDGGKVRQADVNNTYIDKETLQEVVVKKDSTSLKFYNINSSSHNKVDTIRNITNLYVGNNTDATNINVGNLVDVDNVETLGKNAILQIDNTSSVKNIKGNGEIRLSNGKYLEVTGKLNDITLDIVKPSDTDIIEGVYIIAPSNSDATVTLSSTLSNNHKIVKAANSNNTTYSVVKKGGNATPTITPSKIEIIGDTTTDIKVEETGVVRSFSTKVLDKNNKEISVPVKFSIQNTPNGVSITEQGHLKVEPTATTGSVTIKAEVISDSTISATATINIKKIQPLPPSKIKITGDTAIEIQDNNPIELNYEASVYNDKDMLMPKEKVTFTINAIDGVDIKDNGNNSATLTIDPTIFKGGDIAINAKLNSTNSVSSNKTITTIFATPVETRVNIQGDNDIIVENLPIKKKYTAKVYDQFGKEMTSNIEFELVNQYSGVAITKDGEISVGANTLNGIIEIKATAGNISATKNIHIINNTQATENTTESSTESTTENITESTTQATTESTTETITQATTESTTETTTESTIESTTESTTETTTESTTETTTESTTRPPSSGGGGGGSSSGGSSGGGGGGGSSSSKPKDPIIKDEPILADIPQEKPIQNENPIDKPKTPQKEIEVKIEPTIENGQKTVDLSSEDGQRAIDKIANSKTQVASIDLADKNTELRAEVNDIKKILETKDLKVKNNIGEIVLNKSFSNNLQDDNNTINISLKDDKNGIDVKIAVDNKDVKNAENDYMLKINNIGKTNTMVPYVVDKNGKEQIVKKSITVDNDIKMLLNASSKIKFKENKKSMKDTNKHWAKNNIDYVLSRELFSGTTKEDFSPNKTMTRGMLVTVLHRLDNVRNKSTNKFSDVPKGAYYTDPIAWAYENKIVSGTSDGRFLPEQNVTREQLAVIISNYLEHTNADIKRSNFKQFTDFNDVSVWARDSIEDMVSYGLISGKTKDTINPKDTTTRAEVSTIISNLIGKMVE